MSVKNHSPPLSKTPQETNGILTKVRPLPEGASRAMGPRASSKTVRLSLSSRSRAATLCVHRTAPRRRRAVGALPNWCWNVGVTCRTRGPLLTASSIGNVRAKTAHGTSISKVCQLHGMSRDLLKAGKCRHEKAGGRPEMDLTKLQAPQLAQLNQLHIIVQKNRFEPWVGPTPRPSLVG